LFLFTWNDSADVWCRDVRAPGRSTGPWGPWGSRSEGISGRLLAAREPGAAVTLDTFVPKLHW